MGLRDGYKKVVKILEYAKKVRSDCGKRVASQFVEIAFLRLSKNRLGSDEYYEFRAYDDAHYSFKDKLQFVGWRKENAYKDTLNNVSWNVVTSDKLLAYAIFRGLGLPYPEILAVYQPYGRRFCSAIAISEPEELASYLRQGIRFPFFSKPAHGASGRNSVACTGYDVDTDHLTLANGDAISVDDYVASCHPRRGVFPWEAGFIFQELVKPAAECREAFGSIVPGLRLVVFNPDAKPRIFRAILKIPTGRSMTDNFGYVGETGTIIAELDPATGVVLRAQHGIAPDMNTLEAHPLTGASLIGFRIPDWDSYLSLLDYAARAFPGVRLQHWDIAVSDAGPVIFEMNTSGGFGLPQIATRRGFVDDEFVAFVTELGRQYPAYMRRGITDF